MISSSSVGFGSGSNFDLPILRDDFNADPSSGALVFPCIFRSLSDNSSQPKHVLAESRYNKILSNSGRVLPTHTDKLGPPLTSAPGAQALPPDKKGETNSLVEASSASPSRRQAILGDKRLV